MEITKKQENGLKTFLMEISKGLLTDVDFFVNYMGAFPELLIMVNVDWDKLPKEFAYNYNLWLRKKYTDDVLFFLKMVNIPFRGRVDFDIINWPIED